MCDAILEYISLFASETMKSVLYYLMNGGSFGTTTIQTVIDDILTPDFFNELAIALEKEFGTCELKPVSKSVDISTMFSKLQLK
jgi:hypothetical protein